MAEGGCVGWRRSVWEIYTIKTWRQGREGNLALLQSPSLAFDSGNEDKLLSFSLITYSGQGGGGAGWERRDLSKAGALTAPRKQVLERSQPCGRGETELQEGVSGKSF